LRDWHHPREPALGIDARQSGRRAAFLLQQHSSGGLPAHPLCACWWRRIQCGQPPFGGRDRYRGARSGVSCGYWAGPCGRRTPELHRRTKRPASTHLTCVILVIIAIILDALAYRRREKERQALSARGIWISIACGVLMGSFYPLVTTAITGENSLGPYSVAFFFALGTALCAIPFNYALMRKPLTSTPRVTMGQYVQAKASWHLWGIVGGII